MRFRFSATAMHSIGRHALALALALALTLWLSLGSAPALAAEGDTASPEQATAAPIRPKMVWLLGAALKNERGELVESSGELLLRYMRSHWTEVDHEVLRANGKRSMQMLLAGEPVCHVALLRSPERERLLRFTTTALVPPPSLILRRTRLLEVPRNRAGEADLQALLTRARWQGALVSGRSYGPELDKVLRLQGPEGSSDTLHFYSPNDFGAKVLQMLARGRADFTIEYEWILRMPGARAPGDDDGLVALPIAGASALSPSGIACPNSPWGQAAIRAIDRVLSTPEGAAMLREGFLHWLSPEIRQHYGAQLDAFYRRRALPGGGR